MNMQSKGMKKVANYIRRLPPCNQACPAGENIQHWLSLVDKGDHYAAWLNIMQRNPFPAIHGRVCYRYCEKHCNRAAYDQTVGIHCVERFLGDLAIAEHWQLPTPTIAATGKKILIIGAGPAGLSAAYHLRLRGHTVVIQESLPAAGGMMLVGIPAYRLPRHILNEEIQRILHLGIEIQYSCRCDDLLKIHQSQQYDAIFVAIGAHLGSNFELPTTHHCQVIFAVDYLRAVAFGANPLAAKNLVIYGGGNTAIDAARTAKRLGVANVTIIYHRIKEKMVAFDYEIKEAEAEGVQFIFLRTILAFNHHKLTLRVNQLDPQGKVIPTDQFDSFFADALIIALNQKTDSKLLQHFPAISINPKSGTIATDSQHMTGVPGIFAGGDAAGNHRSVTFAVGVGRKAALSIDAYLNDTQFAKPVVPPIADFASLHIKEATSNSVQELVVPTVLTENYENNFAEATQTITTEAATTEAKRCFSCGNCFECDLCYDHCPVDAISKLPAGQGYQINQQTCIGCTKCFRLCPCGAIEMIPKPADSNANIINVTPPFNTDEWPK